MKNNFNMSRNLVSSIKMLYKIGTLDHTSFIDYKMRRQILASEFLIPEDLRS